MLVAESEKVNCVTKILHLLFALIISINVNAQLHADFTANRVEGCSPLIVQFGDLSTGGAIGWLWNLGNGVTSTKQNPSVVYITPGTYTVTLYIKSATGEDSITKTDYITVLEKPDVNFNATPTEGCVPLDVTFTDQSTPGPGTITNWLWDFGDGNTSTEQNPVHKYNLVDSFDVTLEVTNSLGCRQLLNKQSYIKLNGFVNAGFSYTYNSACTAPVTISFNNTSQSNSPLTYQWDFGDGSAISTDQNPKHTYLTTGSFNVKLVATNENGCTSTFTEVISIGKSNTNFTFSGACLNTPIIFMDSSSPTPLKEQWNFGDGTSDTGTIASHTYTTKGTYVVSLNTDFGGCSGSAQKTITISDNPIADFDVTGKRYTCIYPATIQFVNKSTNAKTYQWIFSNGVTSQDENPIFTYDKPGSFNVTLIAFNANGCADTLVKNDFIQIGPPQIRSIQNLPFEGCAPQTLTLAPVIDPDTLITSYTWNFGDGSTSSSPIPTHTYNAGVYDVTLIVTKAEGCADTLLIPQAVSLANRPQASFIATPRNACASTAIQFTDSSEGNITEWKWTFGDGSFSASPGPAHLYKDTGYFNVKLIVGAYQCYDTLQLKNYVHIDGPIAKFTSVSQCGTPFIYQFNDASIAATSWLWNFGDGNTSTTESPSYTYKSTGKYTVSLTVSNGGICSSTDSTFINVIQENPLIQYKFLSSNSCMYDSVRFNLTNYNPTNILSYQWNFGDGVTTRFNPADSIVYHPYSNTGYYTPIVIMRDVNNCFDTVNNNLQIKVSGPTAAFTNKPGDCLYSSVNFTDRSAAEPGNSLIKWIWRYGDGTKPDTLTGGPFNHTYNITGTFNVLLKVVDNNNCYDTATYNGLEITRPVAAFVADDTLRCSQNDIQFIDSSQGLSLKYLWDFGDGNFSNTPSPLHSYTYDSVYDVKLTIQDKYGCIDSLIKSKYITITDPVADFSLNDSGFFCPPGLLIPVNKTAQSYKSILWDFGDGNTSQEVAPQHYYTQAGTFIVKLIVYGYGSCSDTMSKKIVVNGPEAIFTYSPFSGCDTLAVRFSAKGKNSIKYTWDFGNGVTQPTIDTFANYTYTATGKYLPKLVIEDSSGCRVAIINYDTITVATAKANFTATRVPGVCDSSLFDFTDVSGVLYDTINTYRWQFGDGDSSSLSNPKHYYNKAGQYDASLYIITKIGCQSSYQLPVNVLIDSTPAVFAVIPDSACVNGNIQLSAGVVNDSASNYTWVWDFGDGHYANTNNDTYAYSNPGIYNISVSATTAVGCVDTIEQKLVINPSPQTDAGADIVICREQSANLQASGADTYLWTSNPTLSCLSCANPSVFPLTNTTFYVTGSNTFGCKTSDSITVQVKQPANLSVYAPDTTCIGTKIQLKASGAELYKWSPSNLVTNSTDSVTTSTPLSSLTYTVIGTDTKGCFSDTASVFVTVFPIPVIQLKDSVADIEVGSSFQLSATGSPDVTKWLWTPAANISCINCANPVVTPKQTTIYTVNASNAAGCYTERSVTVTVWCNKDKNLFIPNTFSPNGDGMNDYFYPRGKGLMTIKSLRIFNRLGAIVFEHTNFLANQQSYGWDGTYKGKILQPDVYIYVAEIVCENGQVLMSKGNITLLR